MSDTERLSDDLTLGVAGLYLPAIVWDASRVAIVANMDKAELVTFAKRSTNRLRIRLPAFHAAFSQYTQVRERYASHHVLRTLGLVDLGTKEHPSIKQRAWIAVEDQLNGIFEATTDYRRQTGYRACALTALILHDDKANAEKQEMRAFHALRKIGSNQQCVYSALLTKDCLNVLSKLPRGKGVTKQEELKERYSNVLETHATRIRKTLERVKLPNDEYVPAELIAQELASYAQTNDRTVSAIQLADATLGCFEKVNTLCTNSLSRQLNRYCEHAMPEAKIDTVST